MLALQLVTVLTFQLSSATPISDIGLNTVELIKNHGYESETHYIRTQDNYILTYHRVLQRNPNPELGEKPVALLMHGIASSSAEYVDMGPKRSLAYILTEAGYDVWLANTRGNAYSRNHTVLDPDIHSEMFYNFSWHEIGYYDLPAAIDYILNFKQDTSLYYVGHSQGGTVFLVMASTRPEYNEKIKLASLMAPASYMVHQRSSVKSLSRSVYVLESLSKLYQFHELPFVGEVRKFLSNYCTYKIAACSKVFGRLGGNPAQDRIPVIFSNLPSNVSLKQFLHFLQLIKNGGFSQYDYGAEQNEQIYGTSTPPIYDMGQISSPVAVYFSEGDRVVNYKDVKTMTEQLPNVVHINLNKYGYEHTDYTKARNVVNMLYKEMISVMREFV